MRAFILWQVAQVYVKTGNQAKPERLLEMAYAATLDPEVPLDTRDELQGHILEQLFTIAPQRAEELSASAEPGAYLLVLDKVVDGKIAHRDFQGAKRAILSGSTRRGIFPYAAATRLMRALPADDQQERQELFSWALVTYNSSELPGAGIEFEDLGTMVVRFWQALPPKLVLEATDALLDRAKQAPQGIQKAVTMAAGTKTISLDSPYEYRLFQLLPVLRALDSNRAEKLLRNHYNVSEILNRYPRGLQSLDPSLTGGLPAPNEERGLTAFFATDSSAGIQQATAIVEARQREIMAEAKGNLPAALAAASLLPLSQPNFPENSPRADTLTSLAALAASTDPALSRAALEKTRALRSLIHPWAYAHLCRRMADTYLRIGDAEAAVKTLKEALEQVEKVYEEDSDTDDPNQALKANWPSTFLWTDIIFLAQTLSASAAKEILDAIPDSEIQALIELRQIAAENKIPLGGVAIERTHKKQQ
jgi:tetratricopeptide (TPR) repeat protein